MSQLVEMSGSWIDLTKATPIDPLAIIAEAQINGNIGAYANSTDFASPASWVANTMTLSSNPVCSALGTDNLQKVAEAAAWNFQNQTANTSSQLAIPLRNVLYLRGGIEWVMAITFSLGVTTYDEFQLSFLDNAATLGDDQSTYPVIKWTGSFSTNITLSVTLKQFGLFTMGLRCKDHSGNVSMLDMQWAVVSGGMAGMAKLGNIVIDSFLTAGVPGTPGALAAPAAFAAAVGRNGEQNSAIPNIIGTIPTGGICDFTLKFCNSLASSPTPAICPIVKTSIAVTTIIFCDPNPLSATETQHDTCTGRCKHPGQPPPPPTPPAPPPPPPPPFDDNWA